MKRRNAAAYGASVSIQICIESEFTSRQDLSPPNIVLLLRVDRNKNSMRQVTEIVLNGHMNRKFHLWKET
jgi:hypothetical protein